MKKVSIILITLFFGIALSSFSQTAAAPNYFEGKWTVIIKGTPNGDAVVPMKFETKEGKTMGYFTDPESKAETPMSSATIVGDEITVAFTISSYDVTMVITKKDDDHAAGKLMDMFDVEATRLK
ncbi:MAG: hypothetical protein V4683_05555 [Bacteroidota bacterium]